MKKRLSMPFLITLVGVGIYALGTAWASQTGYYNPDPTQRDANIGAGLIALAGIGIGVTGLLWLAVAIIKEAVFRLKSS